MVRLRGLSSVFAILAALGALFGVGNAYADEPRPWETGFQAAATPVMERIESFHTELLYIITAISAFVLVLLLWVIVRYNERANPKPSRTTHNTMVEVVWTVVPILILVAIVVPSFKLLYFEGDIQKPDMIIKAIGHQWYWSYEYTTDGKFTFDANLVQDKDLKQGQLRLLTTEGVLYTCLGHDDQVDLKVVLRGEGVGGLDAALDAAMLTKPARHDFDISATAPAVARHMSVTGG